MCAGMEGSRTLLFGNDSVFHRLPDAKFEGCFGRNLNGFTGLRITPLARFSFRENEFADAGDGELTAGLNLAGRKAG